MAGAVRTGITTVACEPSCLAWGTALVADLMISWHRPSGKTRVDSKAALRDGVLSVGDAVAAGKDAVALDLSLNAKLARHRVHPGGFLVESVRLRSCFPLGRHLGEG